MRCCAQRLTGEKPATPEALLAELGALQSQDYNMSKWAVGLRLKKATHDEVEQAIDRGELIRTHVLRPTWHLVRAADVRWMLALTAPHIKAKVAFYDRQMELDEKIFRRCSKIIEKALTRDRHMSRAALMLLLNKAGIVTDENRSTYILLRAELDGIICSGPRQDKQITYALLEERVSPAEQSSRDEMLALLTRRYLNGHGPATVHDLSWWSGLPVADAKKGVELLGKEVRETVIGEKKYWFLAGMAQSLSELPPALLLPAFDEWIIGYADRAGLFATGHERKIITANGIFKPTLVCKGLVAGSWRQIRKKDNIDIIQEWFHPEPPSPAAQKALKVAERKYTAYICPHC